CQWWWWRCSGEPYCGCESTGARWRKWPRPHRRQQASLLCWPGCPLKRARRAPTEAAASDGPGKTSCLTSDCQHPLDPRIDLAASKSGMSGMMKSLAKEGARDGVRVNAVAPGFIKTAMTAAIPEKVAAGIKALIPLGKDFGDPTAIADAVF